jgi:hypothetical protein
MKHRTATKPTEQAFLRPCDDPLVDIEAEEGILSAMMFGAKVQSLTGDEFTSPDRKALYLAIRSGVDYTELHKAISEPAYVTDLFYCLALAPPFIVEAVAELKRLAALRELCFAVDEWRRKAPTMALERAQRDLCELVRSKASLSPGSRIPGQKSSTGLSK